MAYIDCDKCSHGCVCAYRHQYDDHIVTCSHWKPADDVVAVVRCKVCKDRHSSEFCECRPEDAYCSDGERDQKYGKF